MLSAQLERVVRTVRNSVQGPKEDELSFLVTMKCKLLMLLFSFLYCMYCLNEYVTIAVNRNLSNCENNPKKSFFRVIFAIA